MRRARARGDFRRAARRGAALSRHPPPAGAAGGSTGQPGEAAGAMAEPVSRRGSRRESRTASLNAMRAERGRYAPAAWTPAAARARGARCCRHRSRPAPPGAAGARAGRGRRGGDARAGARTGRSRPAAGGGADAVRGGRGPRRRAGPGPVLPPGPPPRAVDGRAPRAAGPPGRRALAVHDDVAGHLLAGRGLAAPTVQSSFRSVSTPTIQPPRLAGSGPRPHDWTARRRPCAGPVGPGGRGEGKSRRGNTAQSVRGRGFVDAPSRRRFRVQPEVAAAVSGRRSPRSRARARSPVPATVTMIATTTGPVLEPTTRRPCTSHSDRVGLEL